MVAERGSTWTASGLMEPHLVDDLAYKERFYWWHRVRRRNLYRLVNLRAASRGPVLEIGCGTGANLREMGGRRGIGVGMDLDMKALAYCGDLTIVQADAMETLPFTDESFSTVVMLDVLEHVADPVALVEEISRVLSWGGQVVVMVPARPELWSYWDEMHGHQQRFTRDSLTGVFGEGWKLEALEYSFSWMYPVVWGFRHFMQRRRRPAGHSDFIEVPHLLNSLQVAIGLIEGKVQSVVSVPIGTTLCGVWSKDGES